MKNILILDNDKDSLDLIKEILEENNFNVFATSAAKSAIDILKRGIKTDVIILSVLFDTPDSFALVTQFKELQESATVPIITIISSIRTNEKKNVLEKGVDGVIAKPIDEKILITGINNLIKR